MPSTCFKSVAASFSNGASRCHFTSSRSTHSTYARARHCQVPPSATLAKATQTPANLLPSFFLQFYQIRCLNLRGDLDRLCSLSSRFLFGQALLPALADDVRHGELSVNVHRVFPPIPEHLRIAALQQE